MTKYLQFLHHDLEIEHPTLSKNVDVVTEGLGTSSHLCNVLQFSFFHFYGFLFLSLGHAMVGEEKMGHRKRPSDLDRKFVGGDRPDDRTEYLTQQEILPRRQLSLRPLQPVYYLYVRTRPAGSTFLWEAACARPPSLPSGVWKHSLRRPAKPAIKYKTLSGSSHHCLRAESVVR